MSKMPSINKYAIIATAGSRKTEQLVETALDAHDERVMITTYTNENQLQIAKRIQAKRGIIPPNVTILGWFSFLISQCARPYQSAIAGVVGKIRGLNFRGERNRFARSDDIDRYYFDKNDEMYRDGVADFVCKLDKKTDGAVIRRLERIYSRILIDEVQDLAGYDLDVLELLLRSKIEVMMVGDPRQYTFSTNKGSRNKKYRGAGLLKWLSERQSLCRVEERNDNYRCNQAICDFADNIFPTMARSRSMTTESTGHDGVFCIPLSEALPYFSKYRPIVLRDSKNFDTCGLQSMNIGVAKGSTFDRVLIFPTKPMCTYWADRDPTKLKAPERLYVAVTRARHSVTFVVPG
jgi:DNA helicase II / ATP-dependent DNA helicase PcrA